MQGNFPGIPYPMRRLFISQLFIPDSLDEITPEWCTAVFRESTLLTSGAVVGVQTEVIGQDRGFTGVIARARLQYADHEEATPASIIVKLPTANRGTSSAYRAAQAKDTAAARRYFERCAREVLFYQQTAPLNTLPVPWLYYGAVDETAGRVVLVLEDLRSTRPGDALHGCSPREAALVIEQLAHFHARWWNHPQLETFSWLPLWGGNAHIAQQRYVQCLDPFLQRFGSRVTLRIRETIEALASSYGDVRTQLKLAPATMVHADLHLDNVLFSPHAHEPGVAILDWQSVARGRGAIDLALLLFGSLETATRRAVEDILLRKYHTLLLADGVTEYSFAQLLEDCRLALLWLLGAKVVWLGSLDLEHLNGREQALVNASLAEDSFASFFDHDAGSLLAR